MKTIAIYGMQALMGVAAISAGLAKIAGADFMVEAFDMLNLGSSFRLIAGAVEVLGGLCLLAPNAGMVGAALLATVVMGTAGLTVGQVASKVLPGAEIGMVRAHHTVTRSGEMSGRAPANSTIRDGISI